MDMWTELVCRVGDKLANKSCPVTIMEYGLYLALACFRNLRTRNPIAFDASMPFVNRLAVSKSHSSNLQSISPGRHRRWRQRRSLGGVRAKPQILLANVDQNMLLRTSSKLRNGINFDAFLNRRNYSPMLSRVESKTKNGSKFTQILINVTVSSSLWSPWYPCCP